MQVDASCRVFCLLLICFGLIWFVVDSCWYLPRMERTLFLSYRKSSPIKKWTRRRPPSFCCCKWNCSIETFLGLWASCLKGKKIAYLWYITHEYLTSYLEIRILSMLSYSLLELKCWNILEKFYSYRKQHIAITSL